MTARTLRATRRRFLKEREIQVPKFVAGGCSNKSIADRLHITEDTVKGHVGSIMDKLKANDRITHAVTNRLTTRFL